MKKICLVLLLVCFSVFGASFKGMTKSKIDQIYLTGDSSVQKSSKWKISDKWYKGLLLNIDDTSTTSSDSCGVKIDFWGFTKNAAIWVAGAHSDSMRLGFKAITLKYATTHDTVANAYLSRVDTSIVVLDTTTSRIVDGVTDLIQMSFIAGVDSIQAYIYPNIRTKKASALRIRIGYNQVNPDDWK